MGQNQARLDSQKQTHPGEHVYCLLGLPFNAISLKEAGEQVREAAITRERLFFSTPNLNFLMNCLHDANFRQSVINSDLSIMDGMILVWIAKLLGLPFPERVSGSDLIEHLQTSSDLRDKPLKVYFFGGPDGVAARACEKMNQTPSGLVCVGFDSPGFGSILEMSSEQIISKINQSGADILIVALGAKKGQAWIEHNLDRLNVPNVSHLGAVINFIAGTIHRAPEWMQNLGLEWLWRIKEEPSLWKRYFIDGVGFLRVCLLKVLPFLLWKTLNYKTVNHPDFQGKIQLNAASLNSTIISVRGVINDPISHENRSVISSALESLASEIVIDISEAIYLGSGFFGLLIKLKKNIAGHDINLRIRGVSPKTRRFFKWNATEFLLDQNID